MNKKETVKEYKDTELKDVMAKIRDVVGKNVQVVFQTTKYGSTLLGTYNKDADNDYDDSDPSPAAKDMPKYPERNLERDLKRRYPKPKTKDKDLDYIS